jgi:glycosyltransferase involved in cell wall biosynthesis
VGLQQKEPEPPVTSQRAIETTERIPGAKAGPTNVEKSEWPRIALVTPVFNSGKYIEQTIWSVLAQNYPNLDYFIVDGGSTDNTLDVIRKYEDKISGWISEPDNGMYDAINKGFARTTGEIMGWISATDMLQLNGLSVVGSVFRSLPEVEWITGLPTILSDEGMTIAVLPQTRWSRWRFLAGANRTIQQESTFWGRKLWEKAGGQVDASRRYAMDFELWVRFFRHAQIYPVDALIGGFRIHGDSLGLQDMEECYRIHDECVGEELRNFPKANLIKLIRHVTKTVEPIPLVRGVWRRIVVDGLYHRAGSDWPPIIAYKGNGTWGFRGK